MVSVLKPSLPDSCLPRYVFSYHKPVKHIAQISIAEGLPTTPETPTKSLAAGAANVGHNGAIVPPCLVDWLLRGNYARNGDVLFRCLCPGVIVGNTKVLPDSGSWQRFRCLQKLCQTQSLQGTDSLCPFRQFLAFPKICPILSVRACLAVLEHGLVRM